MSISIEDYGNGWYDSKLYYKGKLVATYPCSGHISCVIDEENFKQLELDEQITKELMEDVPIDLLTEEEREEAKRIANTTYGIDAVQYIHTKIPKEGLKTAKAYYDLYINDKK